MDSQPGTLILIGATLLLSLGNLALVILRSQVKRDELDTRTRALVVDLASEAPTLRAQLSEALARQEQYQTDAELAREQVSELKASVITLNKDLQTLRQDIANCHSRSVSLELRNGQLEREIVSLKAGLEGLTHNGQQAGETKTLPGSPEWGE